MEISVLGPLALDTQTSAVSPRDRVVLAALATRPGRPITTDLLTDALWGTDPPASATKVLQGCVSRLRRALGADAVETVPGGYRLTVAGDQLDAVRFERTLARARELDAVGESDRAAYLLGEALELWRGRPFEDLEDWEPAVTEAARLEELRQEAEELRVSTHLAAGHAREVVADADRLVRAAPLRERRWELLAQAQYQSGRQADALHTVHQARAMLVQRLGIDPGPELAGLEQAILRQDESLMGAWSGQRHASGRCPYKGLMAFDLVDAESFVGRDHDLRTCLDIVRRQGVLAVVGPSGYGKSSLLRAGVAAALVDEGDRVVVMTPGAHPSAALGDAWGARGADTLVVDQLEELFTMCEDPSARSAFVEELADLARERRVLMGLRADRMSDLGAYPRLARMVERGLHLLGPMDAESLRAVIEAPARQHGLLLEPGLVDLLVREVEGEPGALPMLSYALQETWRRREGHTLTVAGYQASGGIRGAVAQAAEALYKQVETVRRPVLRDVLMRLVAPGPDSQPVRTRVPRQLVAGDPGQEELVDALIEARLVTSSEGLVEIAHESLTRAWPRLRAWLDDDIEGLRIRHHLLEAAGAWDSLGRPTSEVYRGTRLDQAVEWRESARAELTALERDFLDAGAALADSERQSLMERARTQARMVRRLRVVVGVGAVLLVLSLVAGFLAVRQTGIAETNATSARRAEAVAEARLLAARAVNIDEPVPALDLAIEAVQRDDSAATRSALSAVMDKRRGLSETTPLLEPTRDDTGLQLSPDGTRLATLGRDGRVSIIDADTMQVLRTIELPNPGGDWAITANLTNIEFAPPDTIDAPSDLFVGMPLMSDDPLWILDGQTLKARKARLRMLPERAIVSDLDFSADGRYLAAAFHLPGADAPPGYPIDGLNVADQVRIWDLLHPKLAPRIMRVEGPRIAISNDGRYLYTSKPEISQYEVRSTQQVWSLPDSSSYGEPVVAAIPGGERVLFASEGGLIEVDMQSHEVFRRLPNLQTWTVSTSEDGADIAVVADDGTTHVFSDGPERVLTTGTASAAALSPDGSLLYVKYAGTVQKWSFTGGTRLLDRTPRATDSRLQGDSWMRLSPNSDLVAMTADTSVAFLDVGTGDFIVTEAVGSEQEYGFFPGSWHPNSRSYVSGLIDGSLARVTLKGQVLRRRVSDLPIWAVEQLADGEHIAVAASPDSADAETAKGSEVFLVDATTLEPVGEPIGLEGRQVTSMTVSPDSQMAFLLTSRIPEASTSFNYPDEWAILDLGRGVEVQRGPLPDLDFGAWEFARFSPDGRHIMAGAGRGLALFDLESRSFDGLPRTGHASYATTGSFSPDGSRMVTGGTTGDVALWDTASGELLDRVKLPSDQGWPYPGFSSDGLRVIIPTDGDIFTWNPLSDTLVSAACRMAGRSMTRYEWFEHLGGAIQYHATCPEQDAAAAAETAAGRG